MSRMEPLLFSNSMIFKERAIAEADWGRRVGGHTELKASTADCMKEGPRIALAFTSRDRHAT